MKPFYDLLRKSILPINQIDKSIPKKGKIIDLGCGEGLITKYLANCSKRQVTGIDSNQKRLPNSFSKNLIFKKGDITKIKLQKINGAVISDVLHHLSAKDQHLLLKKIYKNLNKNGVLAIKEIDTNEFIRSKLSRLWDFLLYPHDKINFTSSYSMKKKLTSLGFVISITRPCRLFPGSTTLYICTKR